VWAPICRTVDVAIEGSVRPGLADASSAGSELRTVPLQSEGNGYFSGFVADANDLTLYRYRTNGDRSFPDPASRCQPKGPHGPSQVIDPSNFAWTDGEWQGIALEGQVFYELHLGTFTPEGTWNAAAENLDRLVELGITTLEIMPVAEFPGSFGWGYDGVDLFAPYHGYGTPDDMRRFVDRAHAVGLGVILDVVYNHFGPDGCYVHAFSDRYMLHDRPGSDWGDALNFDGPDSGPVHEYFVTNAGYWISEYHLDGLRLDATHAIHDASQDHILAEVSRHARAAAGGHSILLVAENESQNVRHVGDLETGGYGLDALWNDDFHHAALVALTGHAEAYYCDYRGTAQELISAVKWGYLFQGQHCKWQQKLRGTSTLGVPAARFVTYLENHDQVANSARGLRVKDLTSPGRYRAMATLWLLAPQTPLFFQGQEYGTSRPFVYFSDHPDPLGSLVRQGRKKELAGFRSTTLAEVEDFIPDPTSPKSFHESKLDVPAEYRDLPLYQMFRDLLSLRRNDPVFCQQNSDMIHGAVIGPEALAVRYFGGSAGTRLILVNLGRDLYPMPNSEPLLAPPAGARWSVIWFSEHPKFGGSGIAPLEPGQPWRLSGHGAIVLAAEPTPARPGDPAMGSTRAEDFDIHPSIRDQDGER
jgi:maltooligosyltrehalose trehalohydrolase